MSSENSATVLGQQTRVNRGAGAGGRNAQLDLLRATAILAVVCFHLVQMSPHPLPNLMRFVRAGQYGVDLFFVLSGWLIGTLYWKERAQFGNVELGRFWLRRWFRTIPPYLAALLLAWGAVYFERRQPFNWGYLVFIQNYYHSVPFFLVSWSLCIEEHFYLLVPLLLVVAGKSGRTIAFAFGCLIVLAPVSRWFLSVNGVGSEFGFLHTATHLRMEGLLIGFLAAWLPCFEPPKWKLAQLVSGWVMAGALIGIGVLIFLGGLWMYRLGLTVLAVALIGLLVFSVGRTPAIIANSRTVKWIALTSYSVYLTHALMLHVARKMMAFAPALPRVGYFPVALGLIAVGGGLFYLAFERTAIQLRDKWVTRRPSVEPAK